MIKTCVVCGKEFTTNHPGKLICSPECKHTRKKQLERALYHRNKPTATTRKKKAPPPAALPAPRENHCYHCGKLFKQTFTNEKFCSDDCRIDYFGLNQGYNLGSLFAKILRIDRGGYHNEQLGTSAEFKRQI